MPKPLVLTFRQINGIWRNMNHQNFTLADTLDYYNLIIDDKCEFARYKIYNDNKPNLYILYRAYTGAKITMEIYEF